MARVALWGQLGPNKQSPVWAQATLTESAQFQRCHHYFDIDNRKDAVGRHHSVLHRNSISLLIA